MFQKCLGHNEAYAVRARNFIGPVDLRNPAIPKFAGFGNRAVAPANATGSNPIGGLRTVSAWLMHT